MRRSSLWALCTLVSISLSIFVAFSPRTALAQETPTPERAAQIAIEAQHYEEARALVKDDLASPIGSRRAPALYTAAISYLLQADSSPASAQPYVHALYELAPAFELTDESLPPRVTNVFAAEAARPHSRAVSLAFRGSDDGSFVLEASGRARLSVFCKQGQNAFNPVNLANLTALRRGFRLPTTAVNSCYALAEDEEGLALGRLGSPKEPVTLKPEAKAQKTVLSRWWFWTGVGAVVVGGAVLAYVETRPENKTLPNAELTATSHSKLVFP